MAPLAPTVKHFPGFLGSACEKNFLASALPFFSGVAPEGGGGGTKKKFLRIFFQWPPSIPPTGLYPPESASQWLFQPLTLFQ